MATFGWVPSYSSSMDRQPRVRSVRFGDGYEQRAADGINANLAAWRLTFQGKTSLDAEAIDAFLREQGGVNAFYWAPPAALTSVSAHGFGVGDGSRTLFQLQKTTMATRNLGDWQGVQTVPTTPRTNLLTYSEQLDNAAWSKSNSTVTANAATAPDGTVTADKVVENTATAAHYVHQTVSAINDNAQVCFSVFVKAAERSNVVVEYNTRAGVFIDVRLDLSNNAITYAGGAPTASGVVDYPNGWKRLWFTFNAGVGGTAVKFALIVHNGSTYSYLGDGASGVYFWGGQAEIGTSVTPYIQTTSAAVTVTPAYWPALGDGFEPVTYLPSTPSIYRQDWQGNQLLYSTARTNGVAYSEDYSNAAWVKNSSTIATNFNVAPDGTTTADQWTASAVSANMYQALGSLAAGTYTISRYVKQALSPSCHIGLYNVTDAVFVVLGQFTFATATMAIVGGSGTYSVTPLANGWYRISVTGTIAAPKSCQQYFYGRSTGAGNTIGDTVVVWGDMQETGSVPTAYIPTTSSAVTVTDYTITAYGAVTFSTAPLSGAVLTWTGSGVGMKTVVCKKWSRQFVSFNNETVSAEFEEVLG